MMRKRRKNSRYPYHHRSLLTGLGITAVFLLPLLYLTSWPIHHIWLLAVNGATFTLFGLDKSLAIGKQKRVPEIVLHGFTLAGGAAGQLLGRLAFRHKVRGRKGLVFTAVFLVSAVLYAGSIPFLGS